MKAVQHSQIQAAEICYRLMMRITLADAAHISMKKENRVYNGLGRSQRRNNGLVHSASNNKRHQQLPLSLRDQSIKSEKMSYRRILQI
jgi:hypothetical protein